MGYFPTVDDHLILLGLDVGKKEEFDSELNNLKNLFYRYANKIQKYHNVVANGISGFNWLANKLEKLNYYAYSLYPNCKRSCDFMKKDLDEIKKLKRYYVETKPCGKKAEELQKIFDAWINNHNLSFFKPDYRVDNVFGFEYHAYCYLFFRYADATTLVSGIWKFDPWIPTEGKIWEEIKIMPV